eukprot:2220882-Pleurochrysis_carterae.AAC.1
MRIQRKQIVDVATQGHALFNAVDRFSHCKNARVRFTLFKSEIEQPGKKRPLPTAAGLRHPIDRFFYAANARLPVGPCRSVAGRRVTVDDFIALQLSLQ